jgi:Domain of unknown function (DUF397)
VRNSRHPNGMTLAFTPTAWATFLAGVRRGEFDLDLPETRTLPSNAGVLGEYRTVATRVEGWSYLDRIDLAVPAGTRVRLEEVPPELPHPSAVVDPEDGSEIQDRLAGSTDAEQWVREFAGLFRLVHHEGGVVDTRGITRAWFASAIEVGRLAGERAERGRALLLLGEFRRGIAGEPN